MLQNYCLDNLASAFRIVSFIHERIVENLFQVLVCFNLL